MLRNGFGEIIRNPAAYFRAVCEDRYGFNGGRNEHSYCSYGYRDRYLDDGYHCSCDDEW